MSVLGFEGYLYVNTGTPAAPVWTEVGTVRDLTLTLEGAAVDVTVRKMRGQRAQTVGLHDVGADFTCVVQKPEASPIDKLRTAWFDRTQQQFLIMDGIISDAASSGIAGWFEIQNWTRGENIEDAMTYDTTLLQPDTDTRATWISGGSIPTITASMGGKNDPPPAPTSQPVAAGDPPPQTA